MAKLKEMCIDKMIKFDVDVKDWEEAIRECGEILITNNKVTQKYVDSMIETVKELGPYIVIAPNIAIAHARPDPKEVKENSISLIRLKEPVNFGNNKNDPVLILFSLAAKSDNSHIESLTELARLLSDESVIEKFFYGTTEEVLEVINNADDYC